MEEISNKEELNILAKQIELLDICYDRLRDILRVTDNESVIIKSLEIIRKDMPAALHAVSGKRDAMSDTCERLLEIEKQLKKL
ncbi:MAG: hypothetical protein IKM35_06895 [Bacteroidaceae bacterium]|nr:hypothetical protein [Bacteroidaceae bacterium]